MVQNSNDLNNISDLHIFAKHQYLSAITILISTDKFFCYQCRRWLLILLHLRIYYTNTGQNPNWIKSINPVYRMFKLFKLRQKLCQNLHIESPYCRSGAKIVEIIQRPSKNDKLEWSMMASFLLEKFGIGRDGHKVIRTFKSGIKV